MYVYVYIYMTLGKISCFSIQRILVGSPEHRELSQTRLISGSIDHKLDLEFAGILHYFIDFGHADLDVGYSWD